MNVLLSTAYWPNLHYFFYLLNAEKVSIEHFENYSKQSYRNRCTILSANGPLHLSIPVKHLAQKQLIKDMEISYQDGWQLRHWRAIISAYKNAPYFEYFESDIQEFYFKKFEKLEHYNAEQLNCVLKILKKKVHIDHTSEYLTSITGALDLRETIHPKKAFSTDKTVSQLLQIKYYQTFSEKFDFTPNLSILDLLFNTGLESINYLSKVGSPGTELEFAL